MLRSMVEAVVDWRALLVYLRDIVYVAVRSLVRSRCRQEVEVRVPVTGTMA